MEKIFIPFHKISGQDVIVVDGLHPHNLTLSHWKGTNKHESIAADTSGEIVLNALENKIDGINCTKISATHFDIDGFVGVFSLFYPEFALENKSVLIAMAKIGDFREFNPNLKQDELAIKLCCWMNKVEKEQFYRPFGEKEEIERCVEKFEYFLPLFKEVLQNPEKFKADWELEYNQVMKGLQKIKSTEIHNKIGLIIKEVAEPIHYYALFSNTNGFDIILSLYANNKYELEYKYTTWIDLASRKTLPRIDLKQLCEELNKIEDSECIWMADQVTDTGPILRLENEVLSKAERYANPYEREIYSSSIPKEKFKNLIIEYFSKKYQNLEPQKFWTWKAIRKINQIT